MTPASLSSRFPLALKILPANDLLQPDPQHFLRNSFFSETMECTPHGWIMIKLMMKIMMVMLMAVISIIARGQTKQEKAMLKQNNSFTCRLTTPELQERKRTVIAALKASLQERVALPNGYRYKFEGSDGMIDSLTTFIKTERLCCDFFTFSLTVGAGNEPVWLELTGPEGVKEFIAEEVGF
jgi:hypothetical protein